MPRPLLISSQSDYLIRFFDRNSRIWWQTVQIQISWLLQKPTDLDLHCLLRQGMSCSVKLGLRNLTETWTYANKASRNSHIWWQTVQIQISWLLQKPTDLDLHCLLRQGMSCSAREGLRNLTETWTYANKASKISNGNSFCAMKYTR